MNGTKKLNFSVRRAAMLTVASVAIAQGMVLRAPAAAAQEMGRDAHTNFDIPAGSVADTLRAFAAQTRLQLIYAADLDTATASAGVKGSMTASEALARLLAGTGLTFRFANDQTVTIAAAATGDSERVLGAVRVQGAQNGGNLAGSTIVNGVNGSRDVTATEGTESYTSNALTVGSKAAQTIKDTPMAVSVITSAQIRDQNITDLNSAMRNAPGITILHNSASDLSFVSRGFGVTLMQIDGGAAQNFAGGQGFYQPIIDMSLYDHVEIVRGAAGTFNAYGDPGGVLNLVRKRPLDHSQMLLDMQIGSWDWHRVSVDITGPLAFGGRLRGRLIGTHQDNKYFYNVAKAGRNLVSGTLELDVTPTTLLTMGVNYQEQNDVPWVGGLPRYLTGKPVPLARSTCLCMPWGQNDRKNVELFGQIEQRFGEDWTLKAKGTRIRQLSFLATPGVGGTIDPATGLGAQASVGGDAENGRVKQTLFELTLDGKFEVFGQIQKIVIGANYSMVDPTGSVYTEGDYSQAAFFTNGQRDGARIGSIFSYDPYAWYPASHVNKFVNAGFDYGDFRTLNAYANFELTPLARFHIVTGLRYGAYRSRYLQYGVCNALKVASNERNCTSLGLGAKWYSTGFGGGQLYKGSNVSWPPSIQLKYDLSDNLTGYVSYTDIYVDRSQYLTQDKNPLPPTTGINLEGGLKWLSSSKKLNITISGYYTKQINTDVVQLRSDGRQDLSTQNDTQLNQQVYCCYKNLDGAYNLSYGTDLEITGEVARGLQLAASYNYNFNKSKRPDYVYFDGSEQALVSQAPRHLFKLWASYEFDDRSNLSGLRLGFGANARSKTFVQDSYCPVDPISTPNGPRCPNPPGRKNVFFTDPGFVVFSGSIGYRLNDKLRVDAELENLLDKNYFEQVGGINGGNWYGAPRSVKVTLRGKF